MTTGIRGPNIQWCTHYKDHLVIRTVLNSSGTGVINS